MLYSDITAYFIILATAVTLNVAGITDIETAAQAASALRPLAGNFAFLLFALGILGVGLIGVPVLAGSAAYALREAMGWKWGLERKATDARGFYGVIAVSVLAGLRHPVFADQSDEGAVLERGDQRRRGRAADGGDHPARLEEIGDGRVHREPAHYCSGLDRDRDHGVGGSSDACSGPVNISSVFGHAARVAILLVRCPVLGWLEVDGRAPKRCE